MDEYHKIQTVFLRDPENRHKTLLAGQYARPEFDYLKNNDWVFTEKVNGTNIRVGWTADETVILGGRTVNAQIPAQLVEALRELLNPDKFEKADLSELCLYGEGYGAKIAKGGGNYRPDQSFVLFDVNIDGWWLRRADVVDVARKLGIDVVPVLGVGRLAEMVALAQRGFQSQWGGFRAEGIVARPATELQSRAGKRIITKIKCTDFR